MEIHDNRKTLLLRNDDKIKKLSSQSTQRTQITRNTLRTQSSLIKGC